MRIAVFASGNGSNFEAIVEATRDGRLNAEVCVCVCDRPGAGVIRRAERLGIPLLVVSPRDFGDKAEYERFIADRLEEDNVSLICLAGYMRIVGPVLLQAYPDRILNIHPSLLPAFKGAHAIRDAFDYGVKVYGVTVHFVNEELDGGRIIAQKPVEYTGRDIDELETMIHKVEHIIYPQAIAEVMDR